MAGRITTVAPSPSDPNVAYIGAADGGVWKTTDAGAHWTPLFDSQPSLAIGAIALVPGRDSSSDIVYAGTGEANFAGDSYYGMGLYRSQDGGATWSKIAGTTFDGCGFSRIAVDPSDPLTMLAAVAGPGVSGPVSCGAGRGGVYRTTDGGDDWARVLPGPGTDVVADRSRPGTWYAGRFAHGAWRSTDGGATWEQMRSLPSSDTERVALASAGNRLYVALAGTYFGAHLWTSDDAGVSWTRLHLGAYFCRDGGIAPQCNYDLVLAVDPTDPTTLYAGAVRLYRLTGVGSHAREIREIGRGPLGIHYDFHGLGFGAPAEPGGPPQLWAGSDGGAYRTTDGISIANLNADLSITQFYPGISGGLVGPLLGGTQDNGTQMHVDDLEWTEIYFGDGSASGTDPADPTRLYATLPGGVLLESTDGGHSWSSLFFNRSDPTAGVTPFLIDPHVPGHMYLATNHVYESDNDGGTWRAISGALKTDPHDPCCVSALAVSSGQRPIVYAGLDGGGRVAVKRPGQPWTNVRSTGLPDRYVTDLWSDPADPLHAAATVSGFGSGHVFETADGGRSWTDISGGLPDTPVNAVAVDARSQPATLFVGTDVGVFSAAETGSAMQWQRFGAGLPNTVVMDVSFDETTDQLIAATHGRSVFTAPVPSPGGDLTYPLVVTQAGHGTVTGGQGTIDCGPTCFANEPPGTSITLSASPAPGYEFGGWQGCRSTAGATCTVSVDGPTYARATFTRLSPPLTTIVAPGGPIARNALFRVAWSAWGDDTLGVYDLQFRRASAKGVLGSYPAIPQYSDLAFSALYHSGRRGDTYCFQARALDDSGNPGPWSEERCASIPVDDRAFRRIGRWSGMVDRHFYLGKARTAARLGSALEYPDVTASGFALLAERCPACGSVRVFWNGAPLAKVDLASRRLRRHAVFSIASFGSVETGTLLVKVVSNGKLVAIDGLAVFKSPAQNVGTRR